jgi:hypothetical protein
VNSQPVEPSRSLMVQQRPSHGHLYQRLPRLYASLSRPRRGRLDAVIVPAARPASHLQQTIELSALLGVLLVVLCSKQTKLEQVARRVSKTPGARSLVIDISETWSHAEFPGRTSVPAFLEASADRKSDLSAKRNIGLLLARLHGWSKVLFMDDDITSVQVGDIPRVAGQLDAHQVAGMVIRRFPDNSVVCHARRLAGLWQDVFVSGAVLGVNCNMPPLSFFPDIYNEDWFFFAREAAARELPCVGYARQAEYDPFGSPDRARREEFGDLLAEGIYTLIGQEDPRVPFEEQLRGATKAYWLSFIEARRDVLSRTMTLLFGCLDRIGEDSQVSFALASLAAARNQLDHTITADLCVNFLEAWREDLRDWRMFSSAVRNVGSTREAMDFLELRTWILAEFGAGAVDSQVGTNPLGVQ